jgi:hypothetical protein
MRMHHIQLEGQAVLHVGGGVTMLHDTSIDLLLREFNGRRAQRGVHSSQPTVRAR